MDKPVKLGFTSITVGDSPVETFDQPIEHRQPNREEDRIVEHIDLRFYELQQDMRHQFRLMRESRLSFRIWSWIKNLCRLSR